MIDESDVDKLAELCRIELTTKDKENMLKNFESILGYVSEIQNVTIPEYETPEVGKLHNVMREDDEPYPAGEFTERLVAGMPEHEGDQLKVRSIF